MIAPGRTGKSVKKSVNGLRPFKPGEYDPTRQGRGPKPGAPNAGRPTNRVKEEVAAGLERAVAIALRRLKDERRGARISDKDLRGYIEAFARIVVGERPVGVKVEIVVVRETARGES